MIYLRNKTKKIHVGNVTIGGQNKVVIQSMTNTKTSNVSETLNQINQLVDKGCELVRVAILDEVDLVGLKQICKKAKCPIIADIHFNYLFAIKAIQAGVKKIRINPGNISDEKQLKEIIKVAKKNNVAIRIGINSGSLPKGIKDTYKNIVDVAIKWICFFEKNKFTNLVVSLKSSDPNMTKQLYLMGASKIKYPLHLGVTEAGSLISSIIKSTIGLSEVLQKGIGDTIRISISGDPLQEPIVARKLLVASGADKNSTNIISCPTCGRTLFNFNEILENIEQYTFKNPKKLTVAVMGCVVNGVGESKNADIGIYGVSKTECMLMVKGKQLGKFSTKKILSAFINEYNKL